MLIVGFKPGHDGAIAAVGDRELLYSLEAEKDSGDRHDPLDPTTLLSLTERLDAVPDVIALGGWTRDDRLGERRIALGYEGIELVDLRTANFMGKEVTFYRSTHERSHLLMSVGMAPEDEPGERVVLIWEGGIGAFHLLDEQYNVVRQLRAMPGPGWRYAQIFAIADPTFPPEQAMFRHADPGKLMALAAFGDARDADKDIIEIVDTVVGRKEPPPPKHHYRDSILYNAGVESEVTKIAAALVTERLFDHFANLARESLPAGLPLHIVGGCGLNCDWNRNWRDLGHFRSVFVPPCPNDSGSALGTAVDALGVMTGDPRINWSVYCGLDFDCDVEPDPSQWQSRTLDYDEVAGALGDGRIFAWVQGRYEMGPRALGNRSLIAEPFQRSTHDRLNVIKQREGYRPIAPCCRVEDLGEAFDATFEDPYMLFFRMVRRPDLQAITHVDGSARCQTVSRSDNERLHTLLSAFAARYGVGVLCNTSLNFKGLGFINRMSDLVKYCTDRGVDDMVVGDRWFVRRGAAEAQEAAAMVAP